MERALRIAELLGQKSAIESELAEIRQQMKDEKAALNAGRKSRKKGESDGTE